MTSSEENYVLDANAFIQARRRFYPFDICPGYWEGLRWFRASGRLCSIDKVRDELERGGDDLWNWARDVFDESGCESSIIGASEFADMAAWVQSNVQFTQAAKSEFMAVADGWLAAYAKSSGKVIVTLEEPSPEAKRRVPLVNVCRAFGVQAITPFEMLRRLEVRLSWSPPSN